MTWPDADRKMTSSLESKCPCGNLLNQEEEASVRSAPVSIIASAGTEEPSWAKAIIETYGAPLDVINGKVAC